MIQEWRALTISIKGDEVLIVDKSWSFYFKSVNDSEILNMKNWYASFIYNLSLIHTCVCCLVHTVNCIQQKMRAHSRNTARYVYTNTTKRHKIR